MLFLYVLFTLILNVECTFTRLYSRKAYFDISEYFFIPCACENLWQRRETKRKIENNCLMCARFIVVRNSIILQSDPWTHVTVVLFVKPEENGVFISTAPLRNCLTFNRLNTVNARVLHWNKYHHIVLWHFKNENSVTIYVVQTSILCWI